jgi:hypothetical protein
MFKAAMRKTPIVISNHLKDLVHKKKALDANHHNIFQKQARIKKQQTSPMPIKEYQTNQSAAKQS